MPIARRGRAGQRGQPNQSPWLQIRRGIDHPSLRPRQQHRSGAETPQEEASAGGPLSRIAAAAGLREAFGAQSAPSQRSHPARTQAGAKARAARGSHRGKAGQTTIRPDERLPAISAGTAARPSRTRWAQPCHHTEALGRLRKQNLPLSCSGTRKPVVR